MTIQKHNDEYGWKRGLGAYSKDDREFGDPKYKYDLPGVKTKDAKNPGPAGEQLTGGAPLPRGGEPRFKPKRGPISIAKRPK